MEHPPAAALGATLRCLAVGLAVVTGLLTIGDPGTAANGSTRVSIQGSSFHVNGTITNAAHAAEGLLLNSRMVQAVFDDANPATVSRWAYPDTGVWDAQRNVDEFVSAVPSYAASGLNAVTISLQGGNPLPGSGSSEPHPWHVTAFGLDGSLDASWVTRLDKVIQACDAHGIVVVLALFYQGQDQRLANEDAVVRAVDSVVDWVLTRGYENVLIEIANESGHDGFDHPILGPSRVGELIMRVGIRSGGRLAASTSFVGGAIPPDDVLGTAGFVLVHGNGQDAVAIASMIDAIRSKASYEANPTPIVFNEDSTSLANLEAAVTRSASWGYFDKGYNDYVNGFQAPPVNWGINTLEKRAFFERVAVLTGKTLPAPPRGVHDYQILYSTSADRSAPKPLSTGVVRGDIFVFVAPEADIDRAHFWLDGVPTHTEENAPWDFRGGGATTAHAFDTTRVESGEHTIEAVLELATGVTVAARATFVVANDSVSVASYRLLFTTSPNRSSPVALDGAVARGTIYSFVSPSEGVRKVEFWLDDPGQAGAPVWVEFNPPWDFVGGNELLAYPFATTALADGTHTITAKLLLEDGRAQVVQATFQTLN